MKIWKDIKGYEGLYQICNNGQVKSLPRTTFYTYKDNVNSNHTTKERILNPTDNGYGYLIVGLQEHGKRKNHYIHRLVAENFISEIPEGFVVNHIDYDKTNNSVDNLEVVTPKDNVDHSKHKMKGPKKKFNNKDYHKRYIRFRNNSYEVTVNRKYIGIYNNFKEAVAARDKEIKRIDYYRRAI